MGAGQVGERLPDITLYGRPGVDGRGRPCVTTGESPRRVEEPSGILQLGRTPAWIPNPCDGLQPLPKRRYLPRVLTEEEAVHLVAAADSLRDKGLLLLVFDSGLRLGEVAGLRHPQLRGQWIEVEGKVGVRQVPVSREVMAMLRKLGDGEFVWTGLKGPLTFHGVKLAYRRLFDQAGISGPKRRPHPAPHVRYDVATLRRRPPPATSHHAPQAHRDANDLRPTGWSRRSQGARPVFAGADVGVG